MPEYRQFHSAARSMAVSRLVSPSSEKTNKNCENDGDRQLLSLAELNQNQNNIATGASTSRQSTSTIDNVINEVLYGSDSHQADSESEPVLAITMADKEVIAYVAGSALRSVLQKNKCDICKIATTSTEITSTFIALKQYSWLQEPTGGLLQPTDAVIEFVTKIEQVFRQNIDKLLTRSAILTELTLLCNDSISDPILSHSEHNNDFCNQLCTQYLRTRLHFWAKLKTQFMIKERRNRSLKKKMDKLLK